MREDNQRHDDESDQREKLSPCEDIDRSRAVADADEVNGGQDGDRPHDDCRPRRPHAHRRREAGQRDDEAIGQGGQRSDAGQPVHPAGFEADEVSERRTRVEVRPAGLTEMAGRLRETENEDEDRHGENQRRPKRERAQKLVRLGWEQKDTAADDGIDAEEDEAP